MRLSAVFSTCGECPLPLRARNTAATCRGSLEQRAGSLGSAPAVSCTQTRDMFAGGRNQSLPTVMRVDGPIPEPFPTAEGK
jgi:hypothetical protein